MEDFTRASKTKKVKTDFIDMFSPILCLISAQCGSNSCCFAAQPTLGGPLSYHKTGTSEPISMFFSANTG